MPTPMQYSALSSPARNLLYGGAAGGGKTDYLLMAATLHCANPHGRALILRKTYPDLIRSGSILDRALQWWIGRPGIHYRADQRRFTWPSGYRLEFGHCDGPNDHLLYDGTEFTFIGIDESRQFPENQLQYFPLRLRTTMPDAPPLQYRLTSNPGGRSHYYLRDRYVASEDPDFAFVPATLADNPHLDAEYAQQFDELDEHTRRQMLHGDWDSEPSGGMFDLADFQYVNDAPSGGIMVRSWDFAATAPKPGADPDYTVGVLVHYEGGVYTVVDVARFRKNPAETEAEVRAVAQMDGPDTAVVIEEEGGSSGKAVSSHYTRNVLPDRAVYAVRPTGSKAERARLLASAVRNDNFRLLRRSWTRDMVGEMIAFPSGVHDDQVDALSQAVAHFQEGGGFHAFTF